MLEYILPPFTNKKDGYLNIASTSYPFVLEDKKWPSVDHYRLAKRFEGSILEEDIRKAKTVHIAQKLAKPRVNISSEGESGSVKKEKRYGKDKTCFMRPDWKKQEIVSVETAVLAKFTQNSKIKTKLIETEGIKLVDEKCPCHGAALQKVRYYFINKKNVPASRLEMSLPHEDVISKRLTDVDISHLKDMIKISKKIKQMEGVPHIFEGIMEDAIHNIIKSKPKKVLEETKKWTRNLSWSFIVKNMPNYESTIHQISDIISKLAPPPDGICLSDKLSLSILIASIFKWNQVQPILKKVDMKNIVIPPGKRGYRDDMPKKLTIKKKSAAEKGGRYISLFEPHLEGDKERYSRVVAYFEKMNPVKRDIELDIFSMKRLDEKKNYLLGL